MDDKIVLTAFCILFPLISVLLIMLKFKKPKNKGEAGEQSVRKWINRLNTKNYISIHDVLLPYKDRTTQIDHIVISKYGVFVIENKNMKGIFVGDEKSENWKQVIGGNEGKIHNPIIQNKGHINALNTYIPRELKKDELHNVVLFSDEAKLNVTSRTMVINYKELRVYLKSFMDEIYTADEMKRIYDIFNFNNIKGKKAREEHVRVLKKRLREKERNMQNNICPNCQGQLVLRNGKHGKFIGCSNYPTCKFYKKIENND